MGFLAKNTGKNVSLADSDQIIERQATCYHLPRMVQMTRLEDFFETKRREERGVGDDNDISHHGPPPQYPQRPLTKYIIKRPVGLIISWII